MRTGLSLHQIHSIYGRVARRYDLQHAIITAKSDRRGRDMLVQYTVRTGDLVLDCGAGTGATGIMAAERTAPTGKVILFDLSETMLEVAREKVARHGLDRKLEFLAGDTVHLPFDDGSFDVVLSTYSLCPLYDPEQGALEMYRVTKPGGKLGVAHSTDPMSRWVRALTDWVENFAWRFPWLSLGCRTVDVLPALEKTGAKVVLRRPIGIPLWPFLIFVVEKPSAQ